MTTMPEAINHPPRIVLNLINRFDLCKEAWSSTGSAAASNPSRVVVRVVIRALVSLCKRKNCVTATPMLAKASDVRSHARNVRSLARWSRATAPSFLSLTDPKKVRIAILCVYVYMSVLVSRCSVRIASNSEMINECRIKLMKKKKDKKKSSTPRRY